jgi:hypothetical protein
VRALHWHLFARLAWAQPASVAAGTTGEGAAMASVPTPTKRTVTRVSHSPVVPATTVAGWAHATQANRGQRCALTFRARHHSGGLGPRRPSEQIPEQRPHLSSPPPQWLADPSPADITEARAASSNVVPANTVAG